MLVILVAIITAVVSASVYYTEKWDSPTSSVNQSTTTAKSMASNLMGYTVLAKEYAEANNLYNITLSNASILASATYQLKLMSNYRAVELSLRDAHYVLVSWDTTPSQTTPQEFVISLADNIAEFQQYHKTRVYSSLTPQIYVLQSGCTATLANSYQGMTNKSDYETFFQNICMSNLPQDYTIGKYNLLIQSIN